MKKKEISAKKKAQNAKEYAEYAKQTEKFNKEREEYDKNSYNEKIDVLRLKARNDGNSGDGAEHVKHKMKLRDWLYHYKWLIPITLAFTVLLAVLLIDWLSQERPDLTVLMITQDYETSRAGDEISAFFGEFCEDFNGNGKVLAAVVSIPFGDSADIYDSNPIRFNAELAAGKALFVIADSTSEQGYEGIFYDLEKAFSDCPNIEGYKFFLHGTGFAEAIGLDYALPSDMYLAVRAVEYGKPYEREMEKNFENAMSVLEKIIEQLGV